MGDLVLAAGHSPGVDASIATLASTTNASRSRALSVQHGRETAKATVKEVDVVRNGLKRLETRMHELESRVQYVNPWVVQYMWELLCELRERVGVQYSQQRERGWMEEMTRRGQPNTEPRRTSSSTRATPPNTRPHPQPPHALQHHKQQEEIFHPHQEENSSTSITDPVRLFDLSLDAQKDELDTSLSSESSSNSGADGSVLGGALDETRNESRRPRSRRKRSDGGRLLQRQEQQQPQQKDLLALCMRTMDAHLVFQRLLQEECTTRMELTISENSDRSFFWVQYANQILRRHNVASASVAVPSWQTGEGQYVQQNRHLSRDRRLSQQELPSPPAPGTDHPIALSPIELPVGSPSDFISPMRPYQQGSSGEDSVKGRDVGQGALGGEEQKMIWEDPTVVRRLVEEVSRGLAEQILRRDGAAECEFGDSPSGALPSALLLVVREVAAATAGAQNDALHHQMRESMAHDKSDRAAETTELQEKLFGKASTWEQRLRTVLTEQEEMVRKSRENAETCRAVRHEVLELCSNVTRAVEHFPSSCVPQTVPIQDPLLLPSKFEKELRQRCDQWEERLERVSHTVDSLCTDMESFRMRGEAQERQLLQQQERRREGQEHIPSPYLQLKIEQMADLPNRLQCAESHIATLQESLADAQEAIAIVARKSRASTERLETTKAENTTILALADRLRSLEEQLDKLPALVASAAPVPPPLPSPKIISPDVTVMSVESAMLMVQQILLEHNTKTQRGRPLNPHAQVLAALCAALQRMAHLYNSGTGTFGGSIRLIFAMPPFAVPGSLAGACRSYLREHSAAELKEAVEGLGISRPMAEVLYDCYYWMQSHLLVVGASSSNEPCTTPSKGSTVAAAVVAATAGTAGKRRTPRSMQTVSPVKTHNSNSPTPQPQRRQQQESDQPTEAECATHLVGRDAAAQTEVKSTSPTHMTALEALALSSPTAFGGESLNGVVHHYHHHHRCCKTDCTVVTEAFTSKATSGAGAAATLMPSAVETIHFSATPSVVESEMDENETTPVMREKERKPRTAKVPAALLSPPNRGECLPLPSAISPFTDPQMPKRADGCGSFGLKNPQPFYTAQSEQQSQPQHERHEQAERRQILHNSGEGSNRSTLNYYSYSSGHGPNSSVNMSVGGTHRGSSQRALLATMERSRDELVASILASQLRQSRTSGATRRTR